MVGVMEHPNVFWLGTGVDVIGGRGGGEGDEQVGQ